LPWNPSTASPGAWLTTVASRICLDLLGSARARRERYVGEWIPEPLPEPTEWSSGRPGGAMGDPADRVTLDETVSMAFLVVLDSMTPAQRVAFILHDVFRYSFAEVAEIVGRTPAACRQLASSARRRVRAAPPPATPAARQAGLVRDFKQAWEARDIAALIGLLDPGATVTADGGGLVSAALRPIEGGEQVARYLVDLADRAPGNVAFLERTVNGQPGLVAQQDGVTVTVFAFDIAGDRLDQRRAVGPGAGGSAAGGSAHPLHCGQAPLGHGGLRGAAAARARPHPVGGASAELPDPGDAGPGLCAQRRAVARHGGPVTSATAMPQCAQASNLLRPQQIGAIRRARRGGCLRACVRSGSVAWERLEPWGKKVLPIDDRLLNSYRR
jgi:DNA-directed RNA polymerase specialized sigma24 family protein